MPPPVSSELRAKYRLIEEFGKGAYGTVYRAQDKCTCQEVTVKVVVCENGRCDGQELFLLKHAQGHDNVIKLLDGVCNPFWTALVTEACGHSLREHGKTFVHQIVSVLSSIQIASDIAHAVAHIHGQQLLHRDIHMGNVLINVRQDAAQAKVCDFGLSIFVRDNVQNPKNRSGNITQPFSRAHEIYFAVGMKFRKKGDWGAAAVAQYHAGVDVWTWAVLTVAYRG
jgi:serine/threonine protein kinase